MAQKFTITAELNLQTKNLTQVVNNLRQQFQGANLNVKITNLAQAQAKMQSLGKTTQSTQKNITSLGNSITSAAKRFSAVTLATGTLIGLARAIKSAVSEAIQFEREIIKISQATGLSVSQLGNLKREINSVSSSFGVSSKELITAARELTQAGFAADKVAGSLKILAQTELAATFDSIANTTEGAIAVLNQFGKEAQRTGREVEFLEKSFSAINQVSKEFAVESSDLVTAVRTTGAAFESAGGSLNELLALFTSVRSTTRESAESISTGFRTIFTRTQRLDTINNLRALGVELQDVEGKFVGPMEAVKRLSTALNSVDPRDFRFNLIVEELGGFRQVSKVIPLIQQFAVTQRALNVAQSSSGSLAKDAATAQQSLAIQIQKTREEFLRFIRDLTETSSFKSFSTALLGIANAFIRVGDTLKPLLPLVSTFAAFKLGTTLLPGLKGIGAIKRNSGGPVHHFASGGMVPGSGNGDTVPAMLMPGEFVIRKSSVKKLGVDNLARANKYAGGGPIGRMGGAPASNKFQKGRTDIGLAEDTFHMDKNVSQEKLIIDYNAQNKKFQTRPGQNARGARVKNISSDQIKTLMKNNTLSTDIWENIVADSYGGTANKTQGFPVDIEFNNPKKLKDAKYKPFESDTEEKGVGKTLNYLLWKTFKDRGYSYTGSKKPVQYGRKEKNPVFLGKTLRANLVDAFTWDGEFGFVYPDFGPNFKNGLQTISPETAGKISDNFSKSELNTIQPYDPKKIKKLALGGPAGKSHAARAITIPRLNSYTFDKPAGADLDSVNAKKQAYKLNAEDRLDYDVNNVNVDVSKLKVSESLLEQYNTADDQKRGFRFEDILKETGMAKSLSQVSNARLDGITAAGDPFEAKSRKSAIGISELEDKLYGAISDNISDPEKLARARFNANDLTANEDHIKIGKVTVFEDVTRGLGAAVNTKARMGYAEEEAAKQAKEQNKMASFKAQQTLQDLVKDNFGSGFIIKGKQYSPVTSSEKIHPDVPTTLNQLLGGSYKDKMGTQAGQGLILAKLKEFIVRNPVQNKAAGGSIASLTDIPWMATGGAASGTDTVPAMLTPGEYVINKKSAQAIGYSNLNRMNKVGKFANGGEVQYLSKGGVAGNNNSEFSNIFSKYNDDELHHIFVKTALLSPNFSDSLTQYRELNLLPKPDSSQRGNSLKTMIDGYGLSKLSDKQLEAKYKNRFEITDDIKNAFKYYDRGIVDLISSFKKEDKNKIGEMAKVDLKKDKNFGKIEVHTGKNAISARYIGDENDRTGFITAVKAKGDDNFYRTKFSYATSGYGLKLYETLLSEVAKAGSWMAPDNADISNEAVNLWKRYYTRSDIDKNLLSYSNWNNKTGKFKTTPTKDIEQLKSTWPPKQDPDWALQYKYRKSSNSDDKNIVRAKRNFGPSYEGQEAVISAFYETPTRLAVGGNVLGEGNQDTVPAMLTPGEFVINKKSAEKIGSSALNRMNSVGKYASGGPVGVQHFASGGPSSPIEKRFLAQSGYTGGAAGPLSPSQKAFEQELLRSAKQLGIMQKAGVDTAKSYKDLITQVKSQGQAFKLSTDQIKGFAAQTRAARAAAKNPKEEGASSGLSTNMLLLGTSITSVVSQMDIFGKETADMISSAAGTFTVLKGVGEGLLDVSKKLGINKNALKMASAGLTGYAIAQAGLAARMSTFSNEVDKEGKKFASAVEALRQGVGTTQTQLYESLNKQLQAAQVMKQSSSTTSQVTTGAAGIAGSIGGGILGNLIGGPAGAEIGSAIGSTIATAAAGVFTSQVSEKGQKEVERQSLALSEAMYSAVTGARDFNKFMEKIDKATPEEIAKESRAVADAYKYQQERLAQFTPDVLKNASEQTVQAFNAVSDAARITAQNLEQVIGRSQLEATKKSGELVSLGYTPDVNQLAKPGLDLIRQKVEGEFSGRIGNAEGAEKQNLEGQRDAKIIVEQEKYTRELRSSTIQQIKMAQTLKIEQAARKKLIGTLQQENALAALIEGIGNKLQKVGDVISNVESTFSDSLTGFKSKFNTKAFDLKFPSQNELNQALDPVKKIGPVGENLAKSILDINKVTPDLRARLLEMAQAGQAFDVKKFVKEAFDIDVSGPVGEALISMIENTIKPTEGTNATGAQSMSLRTEETRERIAKAFETFGADFKEKAKGLIQNLEEADRQQNEILQKINESRNKQLDLALQGIDSYSKYVEAIAKARGRDMSLMEKNNLRSMKQYALVGNMGGNVNAIGQELLDARRRLNKGGLGNEARADLSMGANRLETALKQLADQSDKTADTLGEIEKIRQQRENYKDYTTKYTFGTGKEREGMGRSVAELQRAMAAGTTDVIPENFRQDVLGLLQQFKDLRAFNGMTGNEVINRFNANNLMQQGNPAGAQMMLANSSPPEERLIGQLRGIFMEQIKAQSLLAEQEGLKQEMLNEALNQNKEATTNLISKLDELIQQMRVEKITPTFEEYRATALAKPNETGTEALQRTGFLPSNNPKDINGLIPPEKRAFNPNAVIPEGAKAKLDLENIEKTNETIRGFEQAIDLSDKKIYEFTARLENLVKVMEQNADTTKAEKRVKEFNKTNPKSPVATGIAPTTPNGQNAYIPDVRAGFRATGGLIYRAGGGSIFQPKGTDTVPAMLTPGEFVIKKSSVDKVGVDNLHAINSGHYASGGLVSYLQIGGMMSGNSGIQKLEKKIKDLETKVKELEKKVGEQQKTISLLQRGQQLNQRGNVAENQMEGVQEMMGGMSYGDMMNQRYSGGGNGTRRQMRARENANKRSADEAFVKMMGPQFKENAADRAENVPDVLNMNGTRSQIRARQAAMKRRDKEAVAEEIGLGEDTKGAIEKPIPPIPPQQEAATTATAAAATATPPPETAAIPPAVAAPVPPQQEAATTATAAAATTSEKLNGAVANVSPEALASAAASVSHEVAVPTVAATATTPPTVQDLNALATQVGAPLNATEFGQRNQVPPEKLNPPTKPVNLLTPPIPPQQAAATTATAAAATATPPGIMSADKHETILNNPAIMNNPRSGEKPENQLALDLLQQEHDDKKAEGSPKPIVSAMATRAKERDASLSARAKDIVGDKSTLTDVAPKVTLTSAGGLERREETNAGPKLAYKVNVLRGQEKYSNGKGDGGLHGDAEAQANADINKLIPGAKPTDKRDPFVAENIEKKPGNPELEAKRQLRVAADSAALARAQLEDAEKSGTPMPQDARISLEARVTRAAKLGVDKEMLSRQQDIVRTKEGGYTFKSEEAKPQTPKAPRDTSMVRPGPGYQWKGGKWVAPDNAAAAGGEGNQPAPESLDQQLNTANSKFKNAKTSDEMKQAQAQIEKLESQKDSERYAAQSPQQKLREVNAKIDLMTGTREVLPTTQDPYAPPIGVTPTGKGETGPRGLEGANQLQALDKERQELMASKESAKIAPQPVSEFRKNEQARIDANYAEKSANVDKEISDTNAQGLAIGQKKMAEAMNPANDRQSTPESLAEMKKVESIGVNSNPAEYTYGAKVDKQMAELKAKYDAESAKALDADNGELASQLGKQYTKDRMALESQSEEGYSKVKGTGEGVDAEGNTIDTTYGVFDGHRMPAHEAQKRMNQRVTAALIEKNKNPVDENGNAIEGNMLSRGFGRHAKGMVEGALFSTAFGKVMDAIPGLMPTQEDVNKRVDDAAKEPMTEKELADVRHSIRVDQLSRGQLGSTAAHNTRLQQAQKELNAFDSNTGLGDYYPEDAPVSKTKTISEEEKRKRQDDLDKYHRAANPYNANGGLISYLANGGSPKGSDTVPAMLTPGEFVMNKNAVQKHGTGFMNQLNRGGTVQGFANGGQVGYYGSGGGVSGGGGDLAVKIDQFTKTFTDLASQLNGLTVTHTVKVDGQLNIGGIDGNAIATQIRDGIANYVIEKINATKDNSAKNTNPNGPSK